MKHTQVHRFALLFVAVFVVCTSAQHEHHHHGGDNKGPVERPKVFLDKSPRIVWFQLNRLTNERLLLVERSTDHPMYAPVYKAILTRDGMSPQERETALAGLAALNKSDAIGELLSAIEEQAENDRAKQRVTLQLADMLLRQPHEQLVARREAFTAATKSGKATSRRIGYAGLITADGSQDAWQLATRSAAATLDFLAAIPLVPNADARKSLRDNIVPLLDGANPADVRRAAIVALGWTPANYQDTFRRVAEFVADDDYKTSAVQTLLRIPANERDKTAAAKLIETLVKQAEATPAEKRTTDDFIDAMQLTDGLLALLPVDESRKVRARLREIVVRVVRIDTVHEEMRFNLPYFAVEAGRPVQLVLRNEDLMPHNLVVTAPGAMREVAELAETLPPQVAADGRQYVPDSDKVLASTRMVAPHGQDVLTFTAPQEPGEYPYVCTFPRHWMRMYGVMVVVADLDAWSANPTKPDDPLGQNRDFVRNWKVDDFQATIDDGLRGRSLEIGQRIFQEASCLQCHKTGGVGGAVGPDLSDVLARFKGSHAGVMREILDPSYKVDEKYALYNIVTTDGQVLSGIVTEQNDDTITIVSNPEKPAPKQLGRDEVDEMIKTTTSLMPKGLLDRFTQDEIFELLHYLVNAPKPADAK